MKPQSRRRFLSSLLMASGALLINNASAYTYNFNDGIARWHTIEANQLEPLVGQSFTLYGIDTDSFDEPVATSCAMTLTVVYEGKDDPNRPLFLTRRRGVTVQFIPTWGNSCITTDQIVKISHPDINGEEDIFLTSKMDKDGNPFLEAVFN